MQRRLSIVFALAGSFRGLFWEHSVVFGLLFLTTTVFSAEPFTTWTVRHPVPLGTGFGMNAIAWNGSTYVAVGNRALLSSTDGINWVSRAPADFAGLNDVVWNGTRFAGVGNAGAIFTSEMEPRGSGADR